MLEKDGRGRHGGVCAASWLLSAWLDTLMLDGIPQVTALKYGDQNENRGYCTSDIHISSCRELSPVSVWWGPMTVNATFLSLLTTPITCMPSGLMEALPHLLPGNYYLHAQWINGIILPGLKIIKILQLPERVKCNNFCWMPSEIQYICIVNLVAPPQICTT